MKTNIVIHDLVIAHSATKIDNPHLKTAFTYCSRCKDFFWPAQRDSGQPQPIVAVLDGGKEER
jgi:hypothetical protein